MPLIPIATAYLVGSLLTILLPICLLTALAFWYVRFVQRMPDAPAPGEPQPEAPVGAEPLATTGNDGER